jgi:hypothetical protein
MLVEADLCNDTEYDENLIPKQERHHISYVTEMAKLAILRKFNM